MERLELRMITGILMQSHLPFFVKYVCTDHHMFPSRQVRYLQMAGAVDQQLKDLDSILG